MVLFFKYNRDVRFGIQSIEPLT